MNDEFWKMVARVEAAGVPLTVNATGHGRHELLVDPTENLVALAVKVAGLGLSLTWDGSNVRVAPVGAGLPDQTVNEQEGLREERAPDATVAARQVALTAGVPLDRITGSGEHGRILKSDVVDHLEALAT